MADDHSSSVTPPPNNGIATITTHTTQEKLLKAIETIVYHTT